MKRQDTNWEKIFVELITSRRLGSYLYEKNVKFIREKQFKL